MRNLQNIPALFCWLFPSQNLPRLGKSLEGRILELSWGLWEIIIYVDIMILFRLFSFIIYNFPMIYCSVWVCVLTPGQATSRRVSDENSGALIAWPDCYSGAGPSSSITDLSSLSSFPPSSLSLAASRFPRQMFNSAMWTVLFSSHHSTPIGQLPSRAPGLASHWLTQPQMWEVSTCYT